MAPIKQKARTAGEELYVLIGLHQREVVDKYEAGLEWGGRSSRTSRELTKNLHLDLKLGSPCLVLFSTVPGGRSQAPSTTQGRSGGGRGGGASRVEDKWSGQARPSTGKPADNRSARIVVVGTLLLWPLVACGAGLEAGSLKKVEDWGGRVKRSVKCWAPGPQEAGSLFKSCGKNAGKSGRGRDVRVLQGGLGECGGQPHRQGRLHKGDKVAGFFSGSGGEGNQKLGKGHTHLTRLFCTISTMGGTGNAVG